MTGEGKIYDAAPFRINSLQEAADFAGYISRYGDSINSGYNVYDDIVNYYNYSRIHSEDEHINAKLLRACVDLELTSLFMMKDLDLAAGTHNQLHNRGKIASASVLEDFELFSGKANILYALSALSLRTRAFWDKYMGVLFLLYDWQKYEKFTKARSRKKCFLKNARMWPEISLHFRECLTNIVRTGLIHSEQREAAEEIDNLKFIVEFPDPFLKILGAEIERVDRIRTPEVHGSGVLMKWSFANFPIDKSRDFALINHWNVANEFMQALRATIGECSAQNSSPR